LAFAMLIQSKEPVEGEGSTVFVPAQTGAKSAGSGILLILCIGLSGLAGCGNSPGAPIQTGSQDFDLVVSPITVAATAGGSASTFTVSATGQNGFSGSPMVTLSGLPAGATTSPASPFSVTAGGSSQTVTLSLPATVSNGSYTVTASASS
jgi:hypothetical protein